MSAFDLPDPARRERPEPREGRAESPLWLVPAIGAILFLAAGYLFLFSGGFAGDVFDEEQGLGGTAAESEASVAADPVAAGHRLYLRHCSVCHMADGGGMPGKFPPLAGSPFVVGTEGFGENHLARIVCDGLVDPVVIQGTTYNGAMAAWKETFTDAQLAALLTYVRQAWGNAAGPLRPEGVAAVRAEVAGRTAPWTVEKLKAIPPAPLPDSPPAAP